MGSYVLSELSNYGFSLVEELEDRQVVLGIGGLELRFKCCCSAYPKIKALGCPLHHHGPGGSGPVEEAKKITRLVYSLPDPGHTIFVQSGHDNHPVTVLKIKGVSPKRLLVCEEGLPEDSQDPKRVRTILEWTTEPVLTIP